MYVLVEQCRSRYDLSNDMFLEAFRRNLEELQWIQSAMYYSRMGGFSPCEIRFWSCTVALLDVGIFFSFPLSRRRVIGGGKV